MTGGARRDPERGPRREVRTSSSRIGAGPSLGVRRQRLIHALQDCTTATEHCASVATGLPHAESTIAVCRDAACLCRVAAELLARGSAFDSWLIPACLLAADVCESECGVHMGQFFQEAAAACRKLAAIANGGFADGSEVADGGEADGPATA